MLGRIAVFLIAAIAALPHGGRAEISRTMIYQGGGWQLSRVVEAGSGRVSCNLIASVSDAQSFGFIGYDTGGARVFAYDRGSNFPRKGTKFTVHIQVNRDFRTWRFAGQANKRTVTASLTQDNGVPFLKDIGRGSGVVIEIPAHGVEVVVPYTAGNRAVENFLACWSGLNPG